MEKYDKYIAYWKSRLSRENLESKKRAKAIRKIAVECARFLGEHYKVKRVFLIGSLTRDELMHEKSDIDLVVEGLSSHLYISALTALWDKLPKEVEVDLIPLEDALDELKKRIFKEGEVLYERT